MTKEARVIAGRRVRSHTRPKPTDSRLHSNCVVEAYLGTDEPYLRAMASDGARRYQSIQQDGMQSNGTGPASRQLQDKVGGVMPAGLFLLIERRAELLAIVPFVTRS